MVYRLIDPQQYRGQHVLVVGGGDSALEAAASIAEEPNTQVTLSYRSEAFARAKMKNRQRVDAAQQAGRLNVLLRSGVKRIGINDVEIEQAGRADGRSRTTLSSCARAVFCRPRSSGAWELRSRRNMARPSICRVAFVRVLVGRCSQREWIARVPKAIARARQELTRPCVWPVRTSRHHSQARRRGRQCRGAIRAGLALPIRPRRTPGR